MLDDCAVLSVRKLHEGLQDIVKRPKTNNKKPEQQKPKIISHGNDSFISYS